MTNKIDLINPPPPTRFLPVLNEPDPTNDPLELEEGDVVWSDDKSESSDTPTSLSPPAPSLSSSRLRRGLSSVLDSSSTVVRRKSTLSAVSAARLIPPVPTLSVPSRFLPQSAPVNVPAWGRRREEEGGGRRFDDVAEEDDDDDDVEEMVPPHVMVARSHVTAFSVFEGVGRTLKGRDLRRVRNAVFQKTAQVASEFGSSIKGQKIPADET